MTKFISDDDFNAKMDYDPKAVYVAEIYEGVECIARAVFSTKALTEEWLNRPEFDDCNGVAVPYMVDVPDFGNMKKENTQ